MNLSATQRANAVGIIAAVKARGWGRKAAVIAIETALAESGMRMIASANVPESQSHPYEPLSWSADGLGHDHASMGMFQQQTGTAWTPAGYGYAMNQTTIASPNGWGTPAELMNAETSTAKFLDALAHVDEWMRMDPWMAAQAVQRSAFPDGSNYHAQHSAALQIVAELWNTAPTFQEQIMSWYKDRAEFEKALAQIVRDNAAPAWLSRDTSGTRRTLAAWFAGIPGFKQPTPRPADRPKPTK